MTDEEFEQAIEDFISKPVPYDVMVVENGVARPAGHPPAPPVPE